MQTKTLNKKHIIISLLMIVPLAHLATTIYLPSLPAMEIALQSTSESMRWTFTTFIFGLGLSQFIYGPYSDHFGRRQILFLGLLIFIAGTTICIFVPSEIWLIVGRFIQGFGIGVAPLTTNATFGEVFDDQELAKMSSYTSMAHAFPPLIAPFLGGYIQHYFGWREYL